MKKLNDDMVAYRAAVLASKRPDTKDRFARKEMLEEYEPSELMTEARRQLANEGWAE